MSTLNKNPKKKTNVICIFNVVSGNSQGTTTDTSLNTLTTTHLLKK